MKKKWMMVGIAILSAFAFYGCATSISAQTNLMEFDFDTLNDVSFSVTFLEGDFLFVEGNNISEGDCTYVDSVLTISKQYLALLEANTYEFIVHSETDTLVLKVNVINRMQSNRIINSSFETGDLFGWNTETVFKQETNLQAFQADSIYLKAADDTLNISGNYLFGINQSLGANDPSMNERMGRMTSSIFVLGGCGWITFKIGAGWNPYLTYVSVREAETNLEIARYANSAGNSNLADATLISYQANLSAYIGKSLYLEVTDLGGREGNYITIDDVETYWASEPTGGLLASNIAPQFAQAYVTNQLVNGDFANGLSNWQVLILPNETENTTFRVDQGVLKSNLGGDTSIGVIRSSLFKVEGSGVISFQIGAAQGTRFDKDTFISIKAVGTNLEVARIANQRHNGIFLITYYLDLSDYLGSQFYFEIVDNAVSSYDTIFVDNIVTYYETSPTFDYEEMGVNLNE